MLIYIYIVCALIPRIIGFLRINKMCEDVREGIFKNKITSTVIKHYSDYHALGKNVYSTKSYIYRYVDAKGIYGMFDRLSILVVIALYMWYLAMLDLGYINAVATEKLVLCSVLFFIIYRMFDSDAEFEIYCYLLCDYLNNTVKSRIYNNSRERRELERIKEDLEKAKKEMVWTTSAGEVMGNKVYRENKVVDDKIKADKIIKNKTIENKTTVNENIINNNSLNESQKDDALFVSANILSSVLDKYL